MEDSIGGAGNHNRGERGGFCIGVVGQHPLGCSHRQRSILQRDERAIVDRQGEIVYGRHIDRDQARRRLAGAIHRAVGESVGAKPVVFRRVDKTAVGIDSHHPMGGIRRFQRGDGSGPAGIVGQQGETTRHREHDIVEEPFEGFLRGS